jgi:muramidase (phage lysozyme)
VTPNQKAFLDMIADSEIGAALLAVSDNGYNVLEGSTPTHPLLFDSYDAFPMSSDPRHTSTAAGRYQLMHRYFAPYTQMLGLDGTFRKANQDAIALQQVKECRAFDAIETGNIELAVARCAHIWASFPAAGYGQHENRLSTLFAAYTAAGGTLA